MKNLTTNTKTKSKMNFKKLIIILSFFITGALVSACIDSQTISQPRSDGSFRRFSSYDEIEDFISRVGFSGMNDMVVERTMAVSESAPALDTIASDSSSSPGSTSASDFSETNIQVQGVDEPDIVKNDGKYIYYVTNNVVYIVNAFPAEDMRVLSTIEIEDSHLREIFIFDDKLVVMGQKYENHNVGSSRDSPSRIATPDIAVPGIGLPYYRTSSYAFIAVYNIEDRESPLEEEMVSLEGHYYNSRLIDNHLYMISNKYIGGSFLPPIIRYGDTYRQIPASEIFYFDIYDDAYELSTIISMDLNDNSFSEKLIMKGTSQNIFVSKDNIYLTGRKNIPFHAEQRRMINDVYKRMLPSGVVNDINRIDSYDIRESTKIAEIEHIVYNHFSTLEPREFEDLVMSMEDEIENIRKEIRDERDKTLIYRVSVSGKDVELEAHGEVPGYVLNQFSMDERDGHFRIATTRGSMWDERNPSSNNLYVLDMDLEVVGKLENIAPMERIYSVRFMEDRAYMVTFRTIDPLFVIDLSTPSSPEILGELKIPGYSDYLHPYDDNHIIGIGKEVIEDGDMAIPAGVKLALFDVSDVNNPREIAKTEIGHRGSDSEALRDHRAFLFDKSRNLLVIPILEREMPSDVSRPWAFGNTVFQGVYVFEVTPEEGFVERGKITHVSREDQREGRMYMWSDNSVRRSLYMDDVLYTLSTRHLKANSLDTLDVLNSLTLFEREEPEYYYGHNGVSGSTGVDGRAVDVEPAVMD